MLLFCHYLWAKDDVNRYLAPFGASLLREYLLDPQHTFKAPTGFNMPYRVYGERHWRSSAHRRRQGSVVQRELGGFGASSIDVSKDWTILVSGEASATDHRIVGMT